MFSMFEPSMLVWGTSPEDGFWERIHQPILFWLWTRCLLWLWFSVRKMGSAYFCYSCCVIFRSFLILSVLKNQKGCWAARWDFGGAHPVGLQMPLKRQPEIWWPTVSGTRCHSFEATQLLTATIFCEGPRIGDCEVARRCIFNFWIPSVSSDRPKMGRKMGSHGLFQQRSEHFSVEMNANFRRPQKPVAGKSRAISSCWMRLVTCDFCGQVVNFMVCLVHRRTYPLVN